MKLHLPKKLLVALITAMAAVLPTTYGADTISISFGDTTMSDVSDATSELGGVTKDGWNIVTIANTSGTTVKSSANSTTSILKMENISGAWNSGTGNLSTVTGVVQANYIDIPNHNGGNVHTITLIHDYWMADVTYYLSGDANGTWAPMEINGVQYIGGTDNTLDAGENAAWGTRGGAASYDDTNSITVTGLTGSVIVGKNVVITDNLSARATLAGMQVVDASSALVYSTTLSSETVTLSDIDWSKEGQTGTEKLEEIAESARYLSVSTIETGSSLDVTADTTIKGLQLLDNSLTLTSSTGNTLTAGAFHVKRGAVLISNVNLDGTDLMLSGMGEIKLQGNITYTGTVSIDSATTATLGSKNDTTNSFTLGRISNSGTFVVNGPVTLTGSNPISHGTSTSRIVFNSAGTLAVDNNHKVTGSGTLVVGGGTTLTMSGSSSGDSVIRGNIEVLGNGKLVVYGGDTTGYNGSQTSKITLRGESATSLATMQMAAADGSNNTAENGRQAFQTNLEMQGNTLVTGGSIETFGGTITATGVNNEIASTIYVRSNAEFAVTNADDILTISGQIGWRNDNKGTFTKSGAGELKLTNANNHFYNHFTQTGGKTTITGATSTFDGNLSITAGSMSLQGTTSVAGLISVANGASLDVSGNLTISEAIANNGSLNLDSIEVHITSSLDSLVSTQENGVWTKEEYYFITGNEATVTDSVVIVNGNTYTIDAQTGTFNRDIEGARFVIHSGTEMTSTASTNHAYDVHTHGTLVIDSGTAEEAGNTLTGSTGAGNIVLTTDATMETGSASQVTGGLTIRDATLTMGTANNFTGSLASFTSLVLDGSRLNYAGGNTTYNNMSVTGKNAQLHVTDMTGANGIANGTISINGLQLNGDLDISSDWKTKIVISEVSGAGDLRIGKSTNDKKVDISINSLQNYTGTIKATGTNNDSLNTVLSLNAGGATMNLGGLELYNKAQATVNVHGGSSTNLGKVILDNGATLGAFAGTSSDTYTITLDSLTVYSSGKLSFLNQGGGWQGTFNINTLIGTNATLNLDSNCNTGNQSVFNLNGGYGSDFSGIITLKAADTGSSRKTALNINNSSIAQNAIITLDGAGNAEESVSLALGIASVAVRGVNDTSAVGTRYILSGARNMAGNNQDSDSIRRTLVIATQLDDVFTTSATVKNNINLVKTGAGSQAFTGDMSQFNGLIDVQEGTLIIGKDNIQTALGLGGTIRNEGSLILNTNLKASSADLFELISINGSTENGFAAADAELTFSVVSGSGSTTFKEGALIYLGSSSTGTAISENGTFVSSSAAGTYYVLSGDVLTSTAAADTSATLSRFYIGSDGTLKYDGGSFSGVKLAGSGVFNAGNANTMPSELSLSDGWTGTVLISGTHAADIKLNDLGRVGSTVEIAASGISGYFQNADLTFNPNLKLTGNLRLSNGYSNADYIFAGTISGAGNLVIDRTGGTPNSFTFTNSIDGWTGELIHSSGQTDTITFTGAADTINAKINRTGGTLNLTVENVATFNNTVSASAINVNKTTTFNRAATADTISGSGIIYIVGANGSLTQTGGSDKTISPIITLTDGGSLKLATSSDNRTTNLGVLNISGSGKLENATHSSGWQTRLNLGELNSLTPGATLNITSTANTSQRVIVDINGGSYNGLINVSSSNTGDSRKLALNINDADVAADAVIALHGNGSQVALGIGNSEVWVKGIENQANATGTMKIVSGQQAYNVVDDFTSDTSATRTLVIDTDGSNNAESGDYATSATLGSHINLKKLGAGSQTFSGDVSAFNGTIDVQGGMLAFTDASNLTSTQTSLATGAQLKLGHTTTGSTYSLGTLNAGTNSAIHLNTGAILNTFTKGTGTVALKGSGVYNLGSNNTTSNVSGLDQATWTGTVAVANTSKRGDHGEIFDYSSGYNGLYNTGSFLQITNAKGYLQGVLSANLKLVNGQEGFAMQLANGSSGSNTTATFSGSISGSGHIVYVWSTYSGTNSTTHIFSNDTSDWKGQFIRDITNYNATNAYGKVTNVKFTYGGHVFSSADDSNGGVVDMDNSGRLNVTIESGSPTYFNGKLENIATVTVNSETYFNKFVKATTITLNQDATFNGEVTANTLSVAAGKSITLNGGTAETQMLHSVGTFTGGTNSNLKLDDYTTLSFASGSETEQKVNTVGTLTTGTGASLVLGDYATLELGTMTETAASGGNSSTTPILDLIISGRTESELRLNLDSAGLHNTEGWKYNNTVRLSTLREGEKMVDTVRIVSGPLANRVYGHTSGVYAATDLGGAALTMAEGTSLILRNSSKDDGEDFGAGKITLEGTTTLYMYGSAFKLNNDIEGKHLKVTNAGSITFAGSLNLESLTTSQDITFGGGTAQTQKLHSIGTLSATSNNVTIGDYAELALNDYLDLSKGFASSGLMTVGAGSTVKVTNNIWMNKDYSILLKDTAKLKFGDSVTMTGRQGDESLITTSAISSNTGSDKYSTEQSTYTLSHVDVEVSATGDTTMGNKLEASALTHAGSGTLTVSNSGNTITSLAANGDNVMLSESMSVQSISAKAGKVVTVANGKTISMAGGVSICTNGANATMTAQTDNALLQMQENASFTIADMELTNVTITAAEENTKVNLSGLSASDVQLTKGEFHMLDKAQPQVGMGGSATNLVDGVPSGLQFSTSLLNGMTLGADASMVVDLGDLSGFTGMDSGKPPFSITLNGFSIEGFKIGDFLSDNPGIYFAADSWLGQLLVAQGASDYVKGNSLEAGAQATAGSGSGVSVSYNSTAVGTVIIISGLQVPEPATSTLGLIALTALVSRRRRK